PDHRTDDGSAGPGRSQRRGHADRARRQFHRARRTYRVFAGGMNGMSLLPPEIVDLARRVIEENVASGRKIAVAESCTGGLVAAALTEIPGSSAVFDRGFVTYSNEAKQQELDVSQDIIDAFGAVSIACVYAMAQGVLEHSGADVAVAI